MRRLAALIEASRVAALTELTRRDPGYRPDRAADRRTVRRRDA